MATRRWTLAAPPRPTRTVVSALVLILLIGLGMATPDPGRAADPAGSGSGQGAATWSGDRIRAATPRDLVLDAGPDAAASHRPKSPSQASMAAAVVGDEWTGGGAILQRSGVIVFSIGPDDYKCSGSVVADGNDPAYSLVITAAHCAYDLATAEFVTDWMYIPAWDATPDAADCSETLYGCWTARALVVHAGWTSQSVLNALAAKHDYAIAVVGPVDGGSTQLDSLGAYPIRFSGVKAGDELKAFGYPLAPKDDGTHPYDGKQLTYCAGAAGVDPVTLDWGLLCDMTGGSSGGPWLYGATDPASPAGEVASVTSYRLLGGDHLYGPVLDGRTRAVWEFAKSITPDATGTDEHTVSGSVDSATPFTDIAGSTFVRDIEWLYEQDITRGCTPTKFCPGATVTREQMAAFLVRALDLPSTPTDYFDDDESSTFENDINALREAGITTGCTATTFCPRATVTREQMAGFLHRALGD